MKNNINFDYINDNKTKNSVSDEEETYTDKLSDNSNSDKMEEDDDRIDIRSEEIENLFNSIVKLKNALSFTSCINNQYEKEALLGYIESKFTFKEELIPIGQLFNNFRI